MREKHATRVVVTPATFNNGGMTNPADMVERLQIKQFLLSPIKFRSEFGQQKLQILTEKKIQNDLTPTGHRESQIQGVTGGTDQTSGGYSLC